jgi:hypothetical protein
MQREEEEFVQRKEASRSLAIVLLEGLKQI